MSVPIRFPAASVRLTISRVAIVLVIAVIAGCASRQRAPVEDRAAASAKPPATAPAAGAAPQAPEVAAPTYTVKRGDTLYQIALDAGLDYRDLAAWNNIDNVNLIRVGQVLRLTAPGTETTAAVSSSGVTTAPLRATPSIVESKPGATPPATAAS